jgi:hypothetical protein
MAAEKKAKSSAVKNLIMVLFVVAAALFVWKQLEKRNRIQKENHAIAVLDEGSFQEALTLFNELMKDAKTESRKRHQTNIARCYIGLAEAAETPAEQIRYYREAAANDESMIKNPAILKILQAERQREEAGVATKEAGAPTGKPDATTTE